MIDIDVSTINLISQQMAWHYGIVPVKKQQNEITFYGNFDGEEKQVKHELQIALGQQVEFKEIEAERLNELLSRYYRRPVETNTNRQFSNRIEEIVYEAHALNASDIHFEPFEHLVRARFRIDGALIEKYSYKKSEYLSMVNQIKIKSNLDISERRLPQDGRILLHINSNRIDLRVSILPTLYGEKIVIRLLGSSTEQFKLKSIGFKPSDLSSYSKTISKPHGIVLISGPTGSGKTTTLYASLNELNAIDKNIVTIEDPIEYSIDGINQVQLKEKIGLDFPTALRSFLRQDPDIIMLGEIRDKATADMAIRAALTGHLVLSTIHTNSAILTISRLIDMGIPSFMLADTINASVAQRLIRKLCTKCKQEVQAEQLAKIEHEIALTLEQAFEAVGCPDCHYTGYSGRIAIFQVLDIGAQEAELIRNADIAGLKNLSKNNLADEAIEAIRAGDSSFEEVYPIILSA